MQFLTRLTVKSKLSLAFALVPLMTVALIGVGVFRVHAIRTSLITINEVNSVKQRYAINFRGSVHDRAISLRDVVLVGKGDAMATSLKEISTLGAAYKDSAERMDALFATGQKVTDQERAMLADIKEIESRTLPLIEKVVFNQQNGSSEEAHRMLMIEAKPAFTVWLARINKFIDYQERASREESIDARAVADGFRLLMIALCLPSLAVAAVVGYFVIRSIVRMMSNVAAKLGACSGQIGGAADNLSGSSRTLAEGSSQQAASLEETSASLEEIASMTRRNAENAINAKNLSSETRGAAETGSANMLQMNRAMADIQSASGNISKIIKTIDEIAFQTNILALNAAVEAARAGEAGAGFAVVADEVRNLAQRSAQAAKETAEKIEDSISKSAAGVLISGKVTESLGQIVVKARQVDELVAEISTASHEQSQGLDQVNTAITQMDKATQSNAASAEETASASEQLTAEASALRGIVADLQRLVTGSGPATPPPSHAPAEFLETRHHRAETTSAYPDRKQSTRAPRPSLGGTRMALASSVKHHAGSGFEDF